MIAWSRHYERTEPRKRSQIGFKLGERGGDFDNVDRSAFGRGGESLPEFVVVVPNEVARPLAVWRGLPELLGGPSVGGTARHIEMDHFPRPVDYEEECEDGSE